MTAAAVRPDAPAMPRPRKACATSYCTRSPVRTRTRPGELCQLTRDSQPEPIGACVRARHGSRRGRFSATRPSERMLGNE